MRQLRLSLLVLALPVASAAAYATPITFTETVTGSGSLGGTAFINQLVTLTGSGNTSAITNPANYDLLLTSASVKVGSGSAVTFTDPILTFDNNSISGAGFQDLATAYDILDTTASVFGTYALQTSVTGTGTAAENSNIFFTTTSGLFNLSATSGSSTFAAVLNPTSTAPEPSGLVLLGTGGLGFAGVLRRRFRRA